jgi:large subunit ribosomal protein L21
MTTSETTKKKASKEEAKAPEMGAYAVIETGGKQYVVAKGDTVQIEKLADLKEGDKVTFDKVLLMDNGKDTTQVGDPYLVGAKVEGTLAKAGRGKKIRVVKFKSKSRYTKTMGHRQEYMQVKIEALK